VLCANGHENPQGQVFCGTCGLPLGKPDGLTREGEATEPTRVTENVPPATALPSSPAPPSKGPGSTLPWIIAGAAVLVLIAVGGILLLGDDNPSDEPRPKRLFSLTGTLTAPECGGGYDLEFASVEIRDQQDRLIGSTSTSGDSGGSGSCSVDFEVEVPKATFYQITVGTHGGPSYSFEEMQANNFFVELSLD
jgi:hypothetical protein